MIAHPGKTGIDVVQIQKDQLASCKPSGMWVSINGDFSRSHAKNFIDKRTTIRNPSNEFEKLPNGSGWFAFFTMSCS